MFSVNIDKIVGMTDNEKKCYEELRENLKKELNGGKVLAIDTDVTAITAVMEATTEVMANTELTVTMARWKKVRRTSLAV